jgi:steroid 5-alpha reductase family enzyme
MAISEFNFVAWFWSLAVISTIAILGWIHSLARRDVSIVDSLWSLFFLAALITYIATANIKLQGYPLIVLVLVSIWALRLSLFLAWRNHGKEEDRRYQEIRRNNQPNFGLKSLCIIFGLQAVLAWVICLPVLAAVSGPATPGTFSSTVFWTGVALWVIGMCFETAADFQLARFRKAPGSEGAVLQSGLWRYTRHPNYFGEFALWWGYYLMAVAFGGAWTILSPLLMSFLLLRVSGVALLERDISNRRPAYQQYIEKTHAFFPWRPRT